MRDIGGCEVIGIHLVSKFGYGGVDEEGRVGTAGTAPNYIQGVVTIVGSGLDYDSLTIRWEGEVGADVVEFLPLGSHCACLEDLVNVVYTRRIPALGHLQICSLCPL